MQIEFGTIISVRKQFGFIKPCSRQLDIFFHFSSIVPGLELEEVKPGLEVQFLVTQEAGKACAKQVDRAPQGVAVYETITQQQVLGHIISEPTPLHGVCLQGKHTVEGAGVIRCVGSDRVACLQQASLAHACFCMPSKLFGQFLSPQPFKIVNMREGQPCCRGMQLVDSQPDLVCMASAGF